MTRIIVLLSVGALKSNSTHHFFRNDCTKSGSLRFSQFSGCWLILSVYIIMSFDFIQWLSPLKLWVWTTLMARCMYSIQHYVIKFVSDVQLVDGFRFSPGTLVSSTNKTDHHDITEILLKVVLNTISLTVQIFCRIEVIAHKCMNCNNYKGLSLVFLFYLFQCCFIS